MRAGAPSEVLSGSPLWWPTVQSWYGGAVIATSVPVLGGRVTASVTSEGRIRETMDLQVPAVDGRDWYPDDTDHPLAPNGQELSVAIQVGSTVSGVQWTTRVAHLLITEVALADRSQVVTIRAESQLRRVEDAKLFRNTVPAAGSTFISEARRLMPLGLSASFDPALVDRPCPQMEWNSDRLKALQELANAWPALLRTDEWGQITFRAPLPDVPTPEVFLHDGLPYRGLPGDQRGTVVGADRTSSREGVYNEVIARSSAADIPEPIEEISQTLTGAFSVTGPYGSVTREWSSPLLRSPEQARASAETMRKNSVVPARIRPVEHTPDPRIMIDDPAEVVRDGRREWGWVVGYDLPLTAKDGPMRTDVGVVS